MCIVGKSGKSSKDEESVFVTKCFDEADFDQDVENYMVHSCGCCEGEEGLCMQSSQPSMTPSSPPSVSSLPSFMPSSHPSLSARPSQPPSALPSTSSLPSASPSQAPTISSAPTRTPSVEPSVSPTESSRPSLIPSGLPSAWPTLSAQPSFIPSSAPTQNCTWDSLLYTQPLANSTLVGTIAQTNPSKCGSPKEFPGIVGVAESYKYTRYLASYVAANTPVCVRIFVFFSSAPQFFGCPPSSFVLAGYLKDMFDPSDLAVGYLGDSGFIDDNTSYEQGHEFSFLVPPNSDYDLILFRASTDPIGGAVGVCIIGYNLFHDNQCRDDFQSFDPDYFH